METNYFDYNLPQGLIAQHPSERRDGSRMLVVYKNEHRWEHRNFSDFPEYMESGDLLVVNNTRVIPARVFARKAVSGGKVELLFLEELEPGTWDILLRASRRPKPGDELLLPGQDASVTLLEDGELGRARVRLNTGGRPALEVLAAAGEPPLPPYIKRAPGEAAGGDDPERYQTIYASEDGAVAAPTAGLHFTPDMFDRLSAQGVQRAELTLHVGVGTFRPVSVENVEDHVMDEERFTVSEQTAEALKATRQRGGRVVAVGSTSVRTLETMMQSENEPRACSGRSSLFIYPPYQPRIVDALLTNFHLPKSTLLMMVCALAGTEFMLEVYQEAVGQSYRFFSYGDCMLII